jgi:type IV pilus assembly protein PilV
MTRHGKPIPSRKTQGFSLIEVLMSLLLFALGVLGLIAIHAKALQYSADSEDRTRAAMLANEMASQMWAKSSLSASTTAWKAKVADVSDMGLPNGDGEVTLNSAGTVATITVTWKAVWQTTGSQSHQFITEVQIP